MRHAGIRPGQLAPGYRRRATITVMDENLPFVDEYTIDVAAPRETVWAAVRRHAGSLRLGAPLDVVLGTQPRAGFAVSAEVPGQRLDLSGRHRFSTYLLRFELEDGPRGGTTVRALTFAVFPGVRGRVYRALVIGTPGHRIAVRRMLTTIRSRSTMDTRDS
jgi:hypothetical protein